jgi:hypothetical protein
MIAQWWYDAEICDSCGAPPISGNPGTAHYRYCRFWKLTDSAAEIPSTGAVTPAAAPGVARGTCSEGRPAGTDPGAGRVQALDRRLAASAARADSARPDILTQQAPSSYPRRTPMPMSRTWIGWMAFTYVVLCAVAPAAVCWSFAAVMLAAFLRAALATSG